MTYYEVIIDYANGKSIYKIARTLEGANAIMAKEIRNPNRDTRGAIVTITRNGRTTTEQKL